MPDETSNSSNESSSESGSNNNSSSEGQDALSKSRTNSQITGNSVDQKSGSNDIDSPTRQESTGHIPHDMQSEDGGEGSRNASDNGSSGE